MNKKVLVASAAAAMSVTALSSTPAMARDGIPQPCSSHSSFYTFLSGILQGSGAWTVLFGQGGKCS